MARDFEYTLPDGREIVIPEGFVFDGASVPRLLWGLLSPTGLLLIGGLVHDFGYRFDLLVRRGEYGGFEEIAVRDRLSYREWRLVLGWEATPPQAPGTYATVGWRINAEVGYVVGRKLEFDRNLPDISIGDTLLLRAGVSF